MASTGQSTHRHLFLGTKLGRVDASPRRISRAKLASGLAADWRDVRLLLVVAPAGYGKSSLLSEWREMLQGQGVATGWLSLDADDNDPVRILSYLAAAVSDAEAGLGDNAQAQLSAGVLPSIQPVIGALTSDIEACGHEVVLFLDDLHLVTSADGLDTFDRLIQLAPANLRFVIASRIEPPLQLNDLRLRGGVRDLGPAELSFTAGELRSLALLHGMPDIDDHAVDVLRAKTEGWAAGAQLFFLAAQGEEDHSRLLGNFTGRDRSIADYLAEVVLNRQAPQMREFLLKSATLDRMCAEVCRTLLPQANCQAMLEEAEASGLFIVSLDRQREWFRYHHLFGDFLRTRLELERPGELAACRRLASRWFAANGYEVEAVGYALAAKDYDNAAALIAGFAETLVQYRGDHSTLLRWMEALPEDRLERWPQIRIGYAWSLTFTRKHAEALTVLDRLEREAGSDAGSTASAQSPDPEYVRQVVDMIRCVIGALGDRVEEARKRSAAWLAQWPDAPDFNRGTVGNALGYACNSTYEFELGIREIKLAKAAFERCEGHYGIAWASAIHGMLLTSKGLLANAEAVLREGLDYSRQSWGAQSHAASILSLILSEVYYERGELEDASVELRHGALAMQEIGSAEFAYVGHVVEAKLLCRNGEIGAALDVLRDGRRLARLYELPRLAAAFALQAVTILLRAGRLDEASELADRYGLAEGGGSAAERAPDAAAGEFARRARIRLLLAGGRNQDALTQLNQLIGSLRDTGRSGLLITTLILKAAVLERLGIANDALRHLDEALRIGAANGFVRRFLDEEAIMQPVFRRYLEVRARTAMSEEARAPLDYVNRIAAGCGLDQVEAAAEVKAGAGVESPARLTAKEVQLLKLVEKGLSNQQIAETLFISEKTVKWHLNRCFSKLDVRNRTSAVATAKRAALIP